MIKKIAWDAFKNTGDINTFLEYKQIQDAEKGIQEIQKITNMNVKNIENINSSVWYLNCAQSLPGKSLDITVIAPDSSVAIKWAKANDVDFVLSSRLDLTAVSSSELMYEAGGKEYKLPTKYVKSLWNTKLINSQSGENTVAALLDFNNDSTINVKDYVLINKT